MVELHRPVSVIAGMPILVLFLIAAALIAYAVMQPRHRMASLSALGLIGLLALGGLGFARSSGRIVLETSDPALFAHSSHGPVVMTSSRGFDGSVGLMVMLVGFAVVGLLVYGATQPRYRTVSLMTLGTGLVLLVLGGMTFVAVPVARVESETVQMSQVVGGRGNVSRQQEWSSRTVATVVDEESPSDNGVPVVGNRIELFEGTRRTGTPLDKLPDWVSSPVESNPSQMTVDSGPQASFDECQPLLMRQTAEHLAAGLVARHPQTSGWQPDADSIRRSGAIARRVRETQTVRIDVADSVIREPLYREYWMVSSDDAVLDRLLADWLPSASRQRALWLAEGIGLATLLFGSVAVGLRMTGRPQPMPA